MAKKSKLVVLVKVKGYSHLSETSRTPMALQVEVLNLLKGREKRTNLIVWGDDGHLCRPFVSQFKKDSVYVMALDAGSERWGQKKEIKKDFSISNCGAFWLQADIRQQQAFGDVNNPDRSSQAITIRKLRLELMNNSR
jgi:hypothetical protein